MKLKYIIILFVLLSCKKEQETSSAPNTSSANFSAKINGTLTQFFTGSTSAELYVVNGDTAHRSFYISGFSTNARLTVSIQDTIYSAFFPLTVYDSIQHGAEITYSIPPFTSIQYHAIEAYVQLQTTDLFNRKMSGLFHGVLVSSSLEDTLVISDGAFNDIHYSAFLK